jgi:hypothetical protein
MKGKIALLILPFIYTMLSHPMFADKEELQDEKSVTFPA